MRYRSCESYFEVYEDNAKMLCLFKNDELCGRAIVWELSSGTFIDRIYTTEDYMYDMFIDYAKNHKWIIRESNALTSNGDTLYVFTPKDNYKEKEKFEERIILGNRYDYMPYMDSFRYYDTDRDILYTYNDDDIDNLAVLDSTTGEIEGNYETITCDYCGRIEEVIEGEDPEYLHWSKRDECYYCDNCCIYSNYHEDYLKEDDCTLVSRGNSYEDWLLNSTLEDDFNFVLIDDDWYFEEDPRVVYNEEIEEYELKDE